jgi:hypothetical protein
MIAHTAAVGCFLGVTAVAVVAAAFPLSIRNAALAAAAAIPAAIVGGLTAFFVRGVL